MKKQYLIKHCLVEIFLKKSKLFDAKECYQMDEATLFASSEEAIEFLKTTTFYNNGYSIFLIDPKTKNLSEVIFNLVKDSGGSYKLIGNK